ncbi:Calcium/calmodulin-dependent/calcium-dependent protein kinase [Phytophthora cactorum]|nr:Calcium/calmodulin-dependent/calcium-dependent protein kinase [Phytophthora cactorum]
MDSLASFDLWPAPSTAACCWFAIAAPVVQEDGETELQILRNLGRNLVYAKDDEKTQEEKSIASEAVHHECDVASWSDFVDWTTNTRCLLFDYCPYGDLFSHVGSPNGVSLEMARSWFRQVASAVQFLHARNVAHRDLSLENVLLDSFRRCRLADFGLASAAGSSCFGARADIWSLGVILFILVTGIPPFEKAGEVDADFALYRSLEDPFVNCSGPGDRRIDCHPSSELCWTGCFELIPDKDPLLMRSQSRRSRDGVNKARSDRVLSQKRKRTREPRAAEDVEQERQGVVLQQPPEHKRVKRME